VQRICRLPKASLVRYRHECLDSKRVYFHENNA
jgi:hypothetical protein